MPRVLVTTDGPGRHQQTLMDEAFQPDILDDHSAGQLIERLAWAMEDAARVERAYVDALSPRSYRAVAGD